MAEDREDEGADVRKLRRVRRVVEAVKLVINELQHQQRRLGKHVVARTDEERTYLADLVAGYELSEKYLTILQKYQEGRLVRGLTGNTDTVPTDDKAFAGEGMTPYLDDEEPV